MTKSKEIIKTVGELSRHYGKQFTTYLLPWIPTAILLPLFAAIASELILAVGQTKIITITAWAPIGTLLLFIVPWVAGAWVGEIPWKKKDEDNDNKTTQDN